MSSPKSERKGINVGWIGKKVCVSRKGLDEGMGRENILKQLNIKDSGIVNVRHTLTVLVLILQFPTLLS